MTMQQGFSKTDLLKKTKPRITILGYARKLIHSLEGNFLSFLSKKKQFLKYFPVLSSHLTSLPNR